MGKFIQEIAPTEKEFVIQLTQTEVDVLGGIVSDLLDNPQRRVRMAYEVDESYVGPTAQCSSALRGVQAALGRVPQSRDYDYFDYWEEVERLDSQAGSLLD